MLPSCRLSFRFLILASLSLCVSAARSSRADFDIEGYLQHLEATRWLTYDGLVEAYPPSDHIAQVPPRPEAPYYFEQIDDWLELTDGELGLLQRHDFVVSQRWRRGSFGNAFESVWHQDLPVYVSTDAILHAVHQSYDAVLRQAELVYLIPQLEGALERMYRSWPTLAGRYSDPAMERFLADVDVYVSVALGLLQDRTVTSRSGRQAEVDAIRSLIEIERPADIALFNDTPRSYDFSQFRPRGHYEIDPQDPADYGAEALPHYFRAMMWLGRTEFRLTPPAWPDPARDVRREIIDAFLLTELAEMSNADTFLEEIDRVLKGLVGEADNVDSAKLRAIGTEMGLDSVDQLLLPGRFEEFDSRLKANASPQLILSQFLAFPADPGNPEDQEIPYAYLLMGQRFLVDSFATGQVVFPFVDSRGMPDPLDALFSLGNDAVLPFLEGEIRYHGYASNLSSLRWVMDHTGPQDLGNSLYQTWLEAIRTLGRTGDQTGVPDFMRTGAWQQAKMNTQLAAWAELRHDNVLYAKQSYTGGPTCSFPCTYVEPVPALYGLLATFADQARGTFGSIPPLADVSQFFGEMARTMRTLRRIATKELDQTPFTAAEIEFLQSVIYEHTFDQAECDPAMVHDGWYADLFYAAYVGNGDADVIGSPLRADALIADIHTNGNRILHIGTGLPELAIVVAYAPGLGYTAYTGPVSAGFQHTTVNFTRLTDSEWKLIYRNDPPDRPDWTFPYLADRDGNVRTEGRALMVEADAGAAPFEWAPANWDVAATGFAFEVPAPQEDTEAGSVTDPDSNDDKAIDDAQAGASEPVRPSALGTTEAREPYVSVSPNPIESTAVVSFRLATAEWPGPVHLDIFDVRGALVRELYRGTRRSDLVHVRWDGRASSGESVAAGIYYLRLSAGEETITQKLTVLR